MANEPKTEAVNLDAMTAAELEKHIDGLIEKHKAEVKYLRALLRCKQVKA